MALNVSAGNSQPEEFPTAAPEATAEPKGKKAGKAPREPKVKKVKVRKPGQGRKMLTLTIAGALGVVAAGGVYAFSQSTKPATIPIYALTVPIAANTAATADMFTLIEAPIDGIEGTYAITEAELNGQTWFAEEDLLPGAKATDSNFSRSTRIDIALSDPSLMAQTFVADASDSVGGRLRAGDYVSILKVSADSVNPTADFVLSGVLLLDVAGEPSASVAEQAPAPNEVFGGSTDASGQANAAAINSRYQGIPTLYTVALNPEQTRILTAAKSSGKLTVVLMGNGNKAIAPTAPVEPAPDTEAVPAAPVASPAAVLPPVDAAAPVATPSAAR